MCSHYFLDHPRSTENFLVPSGVAATSFYYSAIKVRVQQRYSQGTGGVQWGIVGTSRGTVVVGGGGGRIYRESIKITQKL